MYDRNFKSIILEALEDCIPQLRDKVQAGAVDEKTPTPFATFSIPEERPLRTLSGIAGFETTFEVSLYDSRFAGAEALKREVLVALDERTINGKTLRYRSSTTDYYPQYDLHSVTLTFRIV